MSKFLKWIVSRFWKNFGSVTKTVFRSGQMGRFRFPITMKLKKIKYVIGLNMNPLDKREKSEKKYCDKHGIKYLYFNWSVDSNSLPGEVDMVVSIVEHNEKKRIRTLVHCDNGRDRTGGLIGHWMIRFNRGTLKEFMEHSYRHHVPAEGWLKSVFSEVECRLFNAIGVRKTLKNH